MLNQIILIMFTASMGALGYLVKMLFNGLQQVLSQMKVQTEINRQVQKDLERLNEDVAALKASDTEQKVEIALLKGK